MSAAPISVTVSMSGKVVPMTHSGRAVLVPMTDDEVALLQPGDVALYETGRGLVPFTIARALRGCESDRHTRPFEVPSVEGSYPGSPTFAISGQSSRAVKHAVGGLWYFVETDVRVPSARECSARNFAAWCENEHAPAAAMAETPDGYTDAPRAA